MNDIGGDAAIAIIFLAIIAWEAIGFIYHIVTGKK